MAEYGRQTDEYGNPLPRPGGTGGITGTTGAHGTHGGGVTGTHGAHDGGGIVGGLHRRSGSSSSSSSEDDGLGGRRKKGVKEKIKEKLPGGGNKGEHPATTGVYDQGRPGEKKGMVEKIKEKLPGQVTGHQ
ncbi:hypothetical protein ACS0TY_005632 [Phlomoides rotata]